jgi:two-component system response regulator DctR
MSAPVYLVDDDTGVRDAVSFLLMSRGLEVRAHASGPSLLDALRAAPRPLRGVFLIDIRMEPMSGLRLHEELMALQLRNPVLFLTGHGDVPMAVEALKKGAFDFLEKPYGDNALADRIEQALAVEATLHAQGERSAERTVEVHRARVYAKLGVRSSAEVATLLAS